MLPKLHKRTIRRIMHNFYVQLSAFLFLVVFAPAHGHASGTDLEHLQGCMATWGKHPFNKENPQYRVISSRVKIMGIGGDLVDSQKTETPELVLVKPNVAVMSKTVIKLLNPNAWYCLKGRVSVMGKTVITRDCRAKIAMSNDGATVLGKNEGEQEGGVTVLGKLETNCVNGDSTENSNTADAGSSSSTEKKKDHPFNE